MITSIYNETYCDLVGAMPYLLNKYRNGKAVGNFELEVYHYEDCEGDCEGHTFADEEVIIVQLFRQATQVTLAHELVHVMQALCGEKFSEDEAYALENEISDILYTFRK